MPYSHWLISHHKSMKARKRQLEDMRSKVLRITKHPLTLERYISDYPEISAYIDSKFHDVNVADVKIWVADPEVVDKEGFKDIGGCYIDTLKIIIVKNKIGEKKVRGKFKKMVQKLCVMEVEVEDVIVHELIHAVSARINRASSRYRHMEEEFVYTNCIDFYKQKGMTEEDIVNNNFLPFCLHDVYGSKENLIPVFVAVGSSLVQVQNFSAKQYSVFLNKHAETIVPMIKEIAQKRAYHMIGLYHKYGAEMHLTNAIKPIEDPTSMRFSALDLD